MVAPPPQTQLMIPVLGVPVPDPSTGTAPPSVGKVRTRTVLVVWAPKTRPHRVVRIGQRGRVVLMATVRAAAPAQLTGAIRVLDKGRSVRVRRVHGVGHRTFRLVLRKLAVGTHRLRVVYSGSATLTRSRSAVVIVRVLRRP